MQPLLIGKAATFKIGSQLGNKRYFFYPLIQREGRQEREKETERGYQRTLVLKVRRLCKVVRTVHMTTMPSPSPLRRLTVNRKKVDLHPGTITDDFVSLTEGSEIIIDQRIKMVALIARIDNSGNWQQK